MRHTTTFRELLVADLLVLLDASRSDAVSAFLAGRRGTRSGERPKFGVSIAQQLGIPLDEVRRAEREVDDLVRRATTSSSTPEPEDAAAPAETGTPGSVEQLPDLDPARYTSIEQIAVGGMSVVYAAHDTVLGRRVALKTLAVGSPRDPFVDGDDGGGDVAFAERRGWELLREARTVSLLTHPGIVPIYDLGRTPRGVPYYSMRYVEGERTLLHCIDEAASIEERLALIDPLLDACDAIRFAHAQGVLHRDVKPANIAVGRYGEVLVLDWGLASERVPTKSTRDPWVRVAGTPGYVAPEVLLRATSGIDGRVDVYGLGATLFHVLTGRPPHLCETMAATLAALEAGAPPPPHELDAAIPEPLSQICASALAPDPRERLASVEEFASSLRAWRNTWLRERETALLVRESVSLLASVSGLPPRQALDVCDSVQTLLGRAAQLDPEHPAVPRITHRCSSLRADARQRGERANRGRLLRRIALATLVVAAAATAAVAWMLDDEQARTQTQWRRADALAEFMLEDLYERLEPIGRLDLLGPVAQKVLEHYEQGAPEDAHEQTRRVEALRQVGDVFGARGDIAEARRAYALSIGAARELLQRGPSGAPSLRLAASLVGYGAACATMGDRELARSSWRESESLARSVLDEPGLRSPARVTVATALEARASLADDEWRTGDALRLLRQADELLKPGAGPADESVRTATLRLEVSSRLAVLLDRHGSSAAALAQARATVSSATALAVRLPADARAQKALAQAQFQLAETLMTRGNPRAALSAASACHLGWSTLSNRDPSSALLRYHVASARRALAEVREQLGATNAALQSSRAARDLAVELVDRDPRNLYWKAHLAAAHADVSRLESQRGDGVAAVSAHEASRALWRLLTERDPACVRWRIRAAVEDTEPYSVLSQQGKRDIARQRLDEAVDTLQRLTQTHPDRGHLAHLFVVARLRQGRARYIESDIAGAESAYLEAVRRARRLVADDPTVTPWTVTLADGCWFLAILEQYRKRFDQALSWATESADAFGSIAAPEGADCRFATRTRAAQAEVRLCDLLSAFDRKDEAAAALQRAGALWAIAISTSPDSEWFRRERVEYLQLQANYASEFGDATGARQAMRDVLAARRELVTQAPRRLSYQLDLTGSLRQLADLERNTRRHAAAATLYEECSRVFDGIVANSPDDAVLLERAAYVRGLWGATLRNLREPAAAWRRFVEAHDLHVRAVGAQPQRAPRHAWYDKMLRESAIIAGEAPPRTPAERAMLARWLFSIDEFERALPLFRLALADEGVLADLRGGAISTGAWCAMELADRGSGKEQEQLRALALRWIAELVGRHRARLEDAERALAAASEESPPHHLVEQRRWSSSMLEYLRDEAPWLAPLRPIPAFQALFDESEVRAR